MLQIQSPFQQLFDTNGSPLDDGYVYIGTANANPETSPIAIYWDDAGTIPAAQPLRTLNGYIVRSGTPARVYTAADDFSMTVKDRQGRVVFSVLDASSLANLQSNLAASSGSSLIGFLQSGANAQIRTVQSKLRDFVHVKDFGGVGDGITDDATAINNACSAVEALGGGEVLFDAGTFIVGSTIQLPDNVRLRGAGQKITTIKLKNSTNANIIQKKAGSAGFGAGLCDLTIDGNDVNNTSGGIYWAGASSDRGPVFTFERVTVTKCRPISSPPSGEYGAIVTTGSTWGVARDLDINQNQYAVGWWHKGSDWQIDNLYLGPNGALYSTGTHSMIVQGGAGNIFTSAYFGGNGGLAQVFFWGSSRNLLVNCINDNSWENAYRFVDLSGAGSDNNRVLGGQIRGAGGKTNNTFPAVYIQNSSGNIFSDVEWSGNAHTSSGNAARFGLQEAGTATGNYIVGGNLASNFLTGFVSLAGSSTTMVTSVFGWDSSDIQIATVKKRVNVTGPYDASVPSTSTVPLGRFNGGGALSTWVGAYAYSYTWIQSIQDDGTNTLKGLVLNPIGGLVQIGLGTAGNSPSIANGTANGSVATTLGSVGPTGSTAGNPQGWMRINVAGTDRFIPYW